MNRSTCLPTQPHCKSTAVTNLSTGIVRQRKRQWQKVAALVSVLWLVNLFFSTTASAQSITVTNVAASPVCAGGNVTITFDATNGTGESDWYSNATVYTIYLSNSAGAGFTSQGTFSTTGVTYTGGDGATTTGITTAFTIPGPTPAGTGYKIAIGSTGPTYSNAAGNNPSPAFSVVTTPVFTPTVNIAAAPSGPICAGTPVTFTATAAATGGGTVNYNFKVNGSSVQSSASNSYTSTSFTNGNTVTCEITVTGGCLLTNTATSNTVTMTVNALPICAISGPVGPVCPSSGGIVYTYAAPVMSSYAWTISGNGSISGSSSLPSVTVVAGPACNLTYTLTLTITNANGCQSVCSKTVMVAAPTLTINCPADMTEGACFTQTAIDASFADWKAQFGFTGGCNTTATNLSSFTAPPACGGSVTITYVVFDLCGQTQSCTKTFTVQAPPARIVNVPPVTATSACSYPAQANANAAFAAWLQLFSVNGGCNPSFTLSPVTPTAPNFCGGSTSVTWTVTDYCGAVSTHTSTFTINAAPAVNVTPVTNSTTSACIYADQAAVNTAFSNWLNSFAVSGGCSPTFTTSPVTPTAPNVCGGSTTVTWTVTDHCYTATTHSATFTINAAPAVNVTPVTNSTTSACIYADQAAANTAFSNWLNGFSVSGGCSPTFTTSPVTPTAPNFCGGSTTVTWTVTDHCYTTTTHTATFTIQPNTAPVITGSIPPTVLLCGALTPPPALTVAQLEALGILISDDCTADANLVVTSSDFVSGTCPKLITRTYLVTDACNNSSTVVHLIYFKIPVLADPALVDVNITNLSDVLLNANLLPLNSVNRVHVPILNLDQDPAHIVPSGTTKIRLDLGDKMILDPSFNLATAPLSAFFNWSKVVESGHDVIYGDQIADLSHNFVGDAYFQTIAVTPGVSRDTATFQVTNHANPSYFLIDVVTINNATGLKYVVLDAFTVSFDSKTDVSCFGSSDGSITVHANGGAAPYQYSVDGGSTWLPVGGTAAPYTINGLAAGTYTVMARDFVNQVITLVPSITINQPPVLSATVSSTNVTCFGAANGSITISSPAGGYGTYQYSINGGGAWQASGSFTGLTPGFYNVQIRDAAHTGCIIVLNAALEITGPAVLNATVSSTNVTCNGAADGTITVSAPTGGHGTYEYRLDAGTWQGSGSFTGLAPGTYSVQIRDAAYPACFITLTSITITEPTVLNATVTAITHVACAGNSTGAVTVTATGGTPAYQYSLDAGPYQGSGTFTGLAAGPHSITAKDANGCLKLVNFTINEALNPDLTLGSVFDNNIFFSNGDEINVVYNIAEIKGKAATPAKLRIFKPAGYNILFNNSLTSLISLSVDNQKWQLTTSNSLYYEFSRTGPLGNNTINCSEFLRLGFTLQRATFNVSTFNLNAVLILATGEIVAVNNSNSILLVGE